MKLCPLQSCTLSPCPCTSPTAVRCANALATYSESLPATPLPTAHQHALWVVVQLRKRWLEEPSCPNELRIPGTLHLADMLRLHMQVLSSRVQDAVYEGRWYSCWGGAGVAAASVQLDIFVPPRAAIHQESMHGSSGVMAAAMRTFVQDVALACAWG
ncbi:hypothetical protein B0H19DRAFT_1262547 [Mycena capillaripes]|nr:hypothetical protein B0H19DRAFT_1262547 [Mycena capillaripes]